MNIHMPQEAAENILRQAPSAAAIADRFDSPAAHWRNPIRVAIAAAYLAGQVDKREPERCRTITGGAGDATCVLKEDHEGPCTPTEGVHGRGCPILCGHNGCLRAPAHSGPCTTDPKVAEKWDAGDRVYGKDPVERRRVGREQIGDFETLGAPAKRPCTCLGACKGKDGLATGYVCALEVPGK